MNKDMKQKKYRGSLLAPTGALIVTVIYYIYIYPQASHFLKFSWAVRFMGKYNWKNREGTEGGEHLEPDFHRAHCASKKCLRSSSRKKSSQDSKV